VWLQTAKVHGLPVMHQRRQRSGRHFVGEALMVEARQAPGQHLGMGQRWGHHWEFHFIEKTVGGFGSPTNKDPVGLI